MGNVTLNFRCIFIAFPNSIDKFSPFFQTLARCLILWDDILPNSKWVNSNVPQVGVCLCVVCLLLNFTPPCIVFHVGISIGMPGAQGNEH